MQSKLSYVETTMNFGGSDSSPAPQASLNIYSGYMQQRYLNYRSSKLPISEDDLNMFDDDILTLNAAALYIEYVKLFVSILIVFLYGANRKSVI